MLLWQRSDVSWKAGWDDGPRGHMWKHILHAARGIPLSHRRLIRTETCLSGVRPPTLSPKPEMTWKLKLASLASQLWVLQSQPLIGHDTDVNTTSYGTSKSRPAQGHGFIPKGPTSSQPHKANANSTRVSSCIHKKLRLTTSDAQGLFWERKPSKNHGIESLALPCDVMGDSKEQRFRMKVVKWSYWGHNGIHIFSGCTFKHLLKWTSIEASEDSIAAWISNYSESHWDAVFKCFLFSAVFAAGESWFNPAVHPVDQTNKLFYILLRKNMNYSLRFFDYNID